MNGVLGGRQYAEIENSGAQRLHKHQVAKVPISSYEDAALLLSYAQDLGIFCLCKTDLGRRDNIMPEGIQEICCDCIDILIVQELHAGAAVR